MIQIKNNLVMLTMNRLRDLRTDRDLSQEALGEKIGASGMAISYYEREERGMKPSDIKFFCEFFGVTADYLLGLSAYPHRTVSDSDTRLLAAYNAAPLKTREYVDAILEPFQDVRRTEGAS